MNFDMKWVLLACAVACILLLGKKMKGARIAGVLATLAGIGWAVQTKDYGFVPFNLILLVIVAVEYARTWKSAKVVKLQPQAEKPRRKAA